LSPIITVSSRHKGSIRIALDPVVECDHVQNVQQLPLVLVNSLHLNVEYGVGIDVDPGRLLEVGGKLVLVVLLHLYNLPLECWDLGPLLELDKLVQVDWPLITNQQSSH